MSLKVSLAPRLLFGRHSAMNSVVIGASGGIGKALADALELRGETVHRLSRREQGLDLTDEGSIAAAAAALPFPVIDRLIVATGMLHDQTHGPERSLRQLDGEQLLRSFAVNAVGPALVIKHFAPMLRRDGPSRTALLSARVGSIADNRLGGWYGYRASKAALNQFVRTAAIEIARTRPQAVVVALHPGTVDTDMSRPFQANVSPEKLFSPEHSANCLLDVLDRLTAEQSGGFFDWAGEAIRF
jgi:NAD(P)-dependent dehydrogenase (short-subunit alcohol dehydrogenase family)